MKQVAQHQTRWTCTDYSHLSVYCLHFPVTIPLPFATVN